MKLEEIDIDETYSLPQEVKFCKKCVISNQRPNINFDENGICAACRYYEYKKTINFDEREKELIDLLDANRSKDGSFDCIVPSSGGKDSAYVAHELKTKYNMHPLTVTWSPLLYTDIGWQNLQNFNQSGFDVILGMAKGNVTRDLCREALIEMGDCFQPFIYGQSLFPLKIAAKYNINLVFAGENARAEYGGRKEEWDRSYLDFEHYNEVWFSKYPVEHWIDRGFNKSDLDMFYEFDNNAYNGIKKYFYSYFRDWSNHSNFYYAQKNTGFVPNTERTEGTFTRYSSIDDKIDPYHHYFSLLKFGIGRCTANAAREVREGYRERHEAVALVQRYDSEFPKKYFKDFLNFTNISEDEFWQIADKWRNKKIWEKVENEWKLKIYVT